jgi:hypothetical protein
VIKIHKCGKEPELIGVHVGGTKVEGYYYHIGVLLTKKMREFTD